MLLTVLLLAGAAGSASAAGLARLEKRAAAGDAQAQYQMGLLYQEGGEVQQDYRKAAAFFAQAAEKGHAEARYQLARCYYAGSGVERDSVKARSLLAAAADAGSVEAQFHLAGTYARGKGGVRKNERKAAYWYKRAAEQGHQGAKEHLETICRIHPQYCEAKQ